MIPRQTIVQILRSMLEQVSHMQEKASALDRDLLLSRVRVLYQQILDMQVASQEELLRMQEELSPEIEVEFEFGDKGECECCGECTCGQDCECGQGCRCCGECTCGQDGKCGQGCRCCGECTCGQDCKCGQGCRCCGECTCGQDCKCGQGCRCKGDSNEKCECQEAPLPCPHHGEAPLSALVETIENEINEPEKTRLEAFHNEEEKCRVQHQTIELIASEIAEAKTDDASANTSNIESKDPNESQEKSEIDAEFQVTFELDSEKPEGPENQENEPEDRDEPGDKEPEEELEEESTKTLFNQPISQQTYQSLVNELFESNTALYQNHTAQLQAMDSLDEALIFISENHAWHPDSAVAQEFIALLDQYFN